VSDKLFDVIHPPSIYAVSTAFTAFGEHLEVTLQ